MVAEYLHTLRLFSRASRLYLITAALFGFTIFGGVYPTLLNLYLLRLGYGPEFIGLLNASGALSVAIFCLPAGALGARWGSRRVMITGSVLMAVGNGLLPLADSIPGVMQSGWLLATNIVGALGLALYVTNTNPFLMSVTGSAERNHVFSVQAALGPLAGFAGSLFGGILPGLFAALTQASLDQPGPYRYPLLIAAAMLGFSVLALRAARDVRDTPTKVVASTTGAAPVGLIVLLALVILLQVAGEGVARTFFNVYLDAGLSVPTAQIGALAALGQLLAVPAALFAPVIMARWRHSRAYIASTLGMALSQLPLALIPHWSAAGFGFMGTMMVAATARTVINIFGMEIVAPAWRTVIAGAMSMAVGLSWAIMGLGGGYIITAMGYPFLFGTGALLTAAGALVFWAYFRVPRGEYARRLADTLESV